MPIVLSVMLCLTASGYTLGISLETFKRHFQCNKLSVPGIQHDHLCLNEPCDHEVYIFVNVSIMKRTIPYLTNILKVYTFSSNGQSAESTISS